MLMRIPLRWVRPKRFQPPGFIVPCQLTLAERGAGEIAVSYAKLCSTGLQTLVCRGTALVSRTFATRARGLLEDEL
jgi:hypothetical protein